MLRRVRCRVCQHVERAAIEAAAVTRTIASVASHYELSESALERHVGLHLDPTKDEESPATSRSPGQQRTRPIVAASPDLDRVRNALLEALDHVDAIERRRACEVAA